MQRTVARELMDDPGVDPGELAANFIDIETANRWFGGIRPVVHEVFARGARRVVDVGCGSGDVARALLARARRTGSVVEVVGLDASEAVLAIARARTPEQSHVRYVLGDARALPFEDGAFDVASCNLALHHFEPPEAVAVLRELRRVSRVTPLVCDLVRSRSAYLATLAFARFIARNRLTKHDAPLSVARAYTRREMRALALDAGWRAPRVRRAPFFRAIATDGE